MSRIRPISLVALLVLPVVLVPIFVAHARLDDVEFALLKKDAKVQMRIPAKDELKTETSRTWDKDTPKRLGASAEKLRNTKTEIIAKLGDDDQLRSVEVLVDWAITAAKRLQKEIGPHFEDAQEDLQKFESILRKAQETKGQPWPPKTLPSPDKVAWDAKRYTHLRAKLWLEAERDALYQLSTALGRTKDGEAITWLLKKGLKKLRRAKGAEGVALAAIDAFSNAEPSVVLKTVLAEVNNEKEPAARVLLLDWLGRNKPPEAYDAAIRALEAKNAVVQRAAVRCLVALDERRCVKPLIDLLETARGTLAVEIEAALYRFTGQNFQSSHAIWLEWWEKEGEAFLAGDDEGKRHRPEPVARWKGGTSFYGLETESQRIVFVLDRSGSMSAAASAESRQAGGKPSGPGLPAPEDEKIEGDTRIDVAKSQLIYSIKNIPRDVYFNIVFYSSDVQVWKDPPEMLEANPNNKQAAIEWVEKITAEGSTQLFDALLKAVEYADNLDERDPTKGGCDTIFLLSDGSPTTPAGGEALQGEELESAWAKVKHANRVFQCVIHTIGVGRGHNRSLMQRIANETKVTYKAVGTK